VATPLCGRFCCILSEFLLYIRLNRLFDKMLTCFPGVEFKYAVFLDDDVELQEVVDYVLNTGNAWTKFERYVIERKPAVELPCNKRSETYFLEGRETESIFNFDQVTTTVFITSLLEKECIICVWNSFVFSYLASHSEWHFSKNCIVCPFYMW